MKKEQPYFKPRTINEKFLPKKSQEPEKPEEEDDLAFAQAYLKSLRKPKPIVKNVRKLVPYFVPKHSAPEVIENVKVVKVPVYADTPAGKTNQPGNSGLEKKVQNASAETENADNFPPFPDDSRQNKNPADYAGPQTGTVEVDDEADEDAEEKVFPDFPAVPAEPKAAPVMRTRKHVRPSGNLWVPTTRDLVEYFEKEEIVDGEILQLKKVEDQALLITLAYIMNHPFGIEGYAGSAKTKLMDRLFNIVASDKFYVLTSASDKALYYDQNEINAQDWLYVTEMQKCMNLVEIFKSLAEGKPATHRVKLGKDVVKIALDPKPVCFTRAYDNRWDLDKELRRRFMIIDTTLTPEENEEIIKDMLSNTHKIFKHTKKDEDLADSIRVHLDKLRQKEDMLYIDPFGDCLAEIIPAQDKRLRAYLRHYFQMVRASAKYHLNDRMQFKHGNKSYVVIELADHYNIKRALHRDFINVLKQFEDKKEGEESEFAKYDHVQVDWQKWALSGYEVMKNHPHIEEIRKGLPNFVDKWWAKQTKDQAFWVLDYKTGNDIKIADAPITEV